MPGMRRREFVSAARRRGGRLAARGASAAGGDAGDWVSSPRIARRGCTSRARHFVQEWARPAMSRVETLPSNIAGQTIDHQLTDLAADLVRRQVAVIATPGARPRRLRQNPQPRPFRSSSAPAGTRYRLGLVASLARPGGNVTGFNSISGELVSKAAGTLAGTCAGSRALSALVNRDNPLPRPLVATFGQQRRAIGLRSKSSRQHQS